MGHGTPLRDFSRLGGKGCIDFTTKTRRIAKFLGAEFLLNLVSTDA